MPRSLTQAVRLPGFFVPRDRLPMSGTVTVMFDLIFGPKPIRQPEPTTALRERASGTLEKFFRRCLDDRDEYVASGGDLTFWKKHADYAHLSQTKVSAQQLRDIFKIWVRARKEWNNPTVNTSLTQAVDDFVKMAPDFLEQPEPVWRPVKEAAQTDSNQGGLEQWPPHQFNSIDRKHLKHILIRKHFEGINSETDPSQDAKPELPHQHSSATALRLYLAHESLTKCRPESEWSLFPCPIAFFNNAARHEWYEPSGHQSTLVAPLGDFMASVREGVTQEKQVIAGLVATWFTSLEEMVTVSDWETGESTVRYGMGLVVRYSPIGVQLVVFDPLLQYPDSATAIQRHHSVAHILTFRRKVVSQTAASLEESHGPDLRLEIWWGGKLVNEPEDGIEDPVTMSAMFLEEVVRGGGTPRMSELDRSWEDMGFKRLDRDGVVADDVL